MSQLLPLLAALAIVIAAAKLAGAFANRLGQPAVMGELLMGLVLGPSVIGLFDTTYFQSAHAGETLHIFGELGVIFLMFTAGLEVHLDDFRRAGRPAVLAGALGVVAPIAMSIPVTLLFGYNLNHSIFVGIVLAATSVSISAQTLMELNRLRTREGITLLGAAVVDDVLAIIVLSAFVALAAAPGAGGGALDFVWVILRMIVFFVAAFIVGRLMPRVVAWGDRLPVSEGAMGFVIIIVLIFAWASEAVGGVAAITGAFVAGVALGRSHIHRQIADGMRTLAYSFFVPVFLVNIGLAANFRDLAPADVGLAIALCLTAVVSKIVGGGLGAKMGGMMWAESLRVGIGMISRGEVGLIVAGVGVTSGFVSANVFAVTVAMVLFTTLITPALLRLAFREKES
ncbi:MAG TPA: cation:proton antiporter [Anaerolineales bacterium]|nr:cation:proton antiporter [Anaerolineales bacterium]